MSRNQRRNRANGLNLSTFSYYYDRLKELSLSVFDWKGLPDSCDARYLELVLFEDGVACFVEDEEMGLLNLSVSPQGRLDVYGRPVDRRAYSRYNQYQQDVNDENSVLVYNNMLRLPSHQTCYLYASRLAELDRIIDVNTKAQKTPVLVQADEKQRLTLLNVYDQYDGNAPVIFGDKNLDLNALKVLQTGAPFVSPQLYELKTNLWNEALTYLGIPNVSTTKKERLISDEVQRYQGGTLASRFSRYTAREEAAEAVNKMFGTSIEVVFRDTEADSPSRLPDPDFDRQMSGVLEEPEEEDEDDE